MDFQNLELAPLPLPVGRVFREFDECVLQPDEVRSQKPPTNPKEIKKAAKAADKRRKKVMKVLENFIAELAVIYNLDESVWKTCAFPWGAIFHQRMVSTQRLLKCDHIQQYIELTTSYAEVFKQSKKGKVGRQAGVVVSLLEWLKLHTIDTDNAIIGLTPNEEFCEQYEAIMQKKKEKEGESEYKEKAAELLKKEGNADPRFLYSFGYPAMRGDVVVTKLNLKDDSVADIRKKCFSDKQAEGLDSIYIYCRIKDAVSLKLKKLNEDNKSNQKRTFLCLWIAPDEEIEVQVDSEECVPLTEFVNVNLLMDRRGDALKTRSLIQDPFNHFRRYVRNHIKDEAFKALQGMGIDTDVEPLLTRMDALTYINRIITASKQLENIDEEKINALGKEMQAWGGRELADFVNQLNAMDGSSSNKIFMPTSAKDLAEVSTMSFDKCTKETVQQFKDSVLQAAKSLQVEKKEILNGSLKQQITKWWLLLIQTNCEVFLASTDYILDAFSEETYIDEPPKDIEGVKFNLTLVQEFIKPNNEQIDALVENFKKEIYAAIDDFIFKAHIVLQFELFNKELPEDHSFDLQQATEHLQENKEKIIEEHSEEYFLQMDGLTKDLKYLIEMKVLEAEQERKKANPNEEKGGKLALTYAVPVSGLVMGFFFRLENVLKTVLELWDIKPRVPTTEQNGATANNSDASSEKASPTEGSEISEQTAENTEVKLDTEAPTPTPTTTNEADEQVVEERDSDNESAELSAESEDANETEESTVTEEDICKTDIFAIATDVTPCSTDYISPLVPKPIEPPTPSWVSDKKQRTKKKRKKAPLQRSKSNAAPKRNKKRLASQASSLKRERSKVGTAPPIPIVTNNSTSAITTSTTTSTTTSDDEKPYESE